MQSEAVYLASTEASKHDRASFAATHMIHEALEKIVADEDLSRAKPKPRWRRFFLGARPTRRSPRCSPALRMKGETVDELVGFATAMRRHATPIFAGHPPCRRSAGGHLRHRRRRLRHVQRLHRRGFRRGGRGRARGQARQPLDQLALRLGGRSRRAGRADRSSAGARGARDRRIGIGFLFAPAMHAATRHAMPARRELRCAPCSICSARSRIPPGLGAGRRRLRCELDGA